MQVNISQFVLRVYMYFCCHNPPTHHCDHVGVTHVGVTLYLLSGIASPPG